MGGFTRTSGAHKIFATAQKCILILLEPERISGFSGSMAKTTEQTGIIDGAGEEALGEGWEVVDGFGGGFLRKYRGMLTGLGG